MSIEPFFKLTHYLGHSYYYTWVLNSYDRDIFRILVDSALVKKSDYYDEGIIITNASIRHLSFKVGMARSTVIRSLNKLNKLGMIITFKYGSNRNSSYLLGFRTDINDRVYLLEHLVAQYDETISNAIDNAMDLLKTKKSIPKLKDPYIWCLKKEYRDFILNNIHNPAALKHTRISGDKKIYETLFKRNDEYRKPLSEGKIRRALLGRSGIEQIEI
jgi:DNA-binding Lrp family transcriptional regulator